ncbi:hypothetical protein O6H91_02G111900 [Diphasiastrum complanatum]|uniref:Uncharacterized protein n=1 Tax=Diphasiastrum complanatum TaxID=34168 RepID=A0ACC2EJR8_DIPCM|nr:hypothetical protein O6H91_Y218200 [Diphasiastrum complanatum]KAJ7566630.1 hypothetical protein O6H91_02G111900 [Diphasiastrum complanatum]
MAGLALATWKEAPLPLSSLNHISRNCANIQESLDFYVNLLGFVPIKRPGFLNFDGAWLFNYGIGIHLLQEEVPADRHSLHATDVINPRNDHISFQCDDIEVVGKRLSEAGIKYVRRVVEEGGIEVEQLFFHDPDGFMIEVCTCEKLPLEPIAGSSCYREFCQRQLPSACHLVPYPATNHTY